MALSQQRALKTALISLALGGLFLLGLPNLAGNPALASRVGQPGRTGPSGVGAGVQISTPEVLITSTTYLPILHVFTVELNGFWVEDQASVRRNGFEPGEGMVFVTDGWVNRPDSVTTTLKLTDTGPCESGVVFSQTVALPPNGWVYLVPETAQNCTGIFTTTTSLTFGEVVLSKSAEHVVNPPSQVAVSGHPGFDKCAVTSVENMQTWWDESPYAVTNLYIGGAAFACPNQALDAVWIHKVAKQGWTFIPTWVGPQAPCTGFNHRMSWNASTAYQEGKDEAAAAAAAARNYGFFGGNVIYYDLEAFPNASTACRAATDAFMTGWTEQLHDLGFKAGGYGQECSSYMTDWVDNSPSPDDIWWARWPFPPWSYDPTASVFGSSCIPDNYWDDHQRIRQYTGGHQETWGPTTLTIDSNILDGEVNLLPVGSPRVEGELQQATVIYEGPAIRGHGLTGPGEGWVWVDERILKSENGGIGWQEITPDRLVPIGVSFRDKWNGMVVGLGAGHYAVQTARTVDGGSSWATSAIPLDNATADLVQAAYVEALDVNNIWVVLQLQSGSSFSRGLLYFSSDGGETWLERRAPLGEPVFFLSPEQGWSFGGPAGDQVFHTTDGGLTWQLSGEPLPQEIAVRSAAAGLLSQSGAAAIFESPASMISAERFGDQYAWVVVQDGLCTGDKLAPADGSAPEPFECRQRRSLLATQDGGLTWSEVLLPGY